jgi:hypothetical protein
MLRTLDSLLILLLYVHDLLIIGGSASTISMAKYILHKNFSMTDMGPLHYFLGIEISQDSSRIKISQTKYARYFFITLHTTDCKLKATPFLSGVHLDDGGDTPVLENTLYRQLVWNLLYLNQNQEYLSNVLNFYLYI